MLIIKDIVSDTFTNASGYTLYTVLKSELDKSEDFISLSFDGVTSTSSSFLNSSIGAIIEGYGFDVLKKIKPVNVGVTQSEVLKKYISSMQKTARK